MRRICPPRFSRIISLPDRVGVEGGEIEVAPQIDDDRLPLGDINGRWDLELSLNASLAMSWRMADDFSAAIERASAAVRLGSVVIVVDRTGDRIDRRDRAGAFRRGIAERGTFRRSPRMIASLGPPQKCVSISPVSPARPSRSAPGEAISAKGYRSG